MATFYLLPPRPAFEDSFAQFIQSWLPGLSLPTGSATDLADSFHSKLSRQSDCFIIFREELPDGVELGQGLHDGFGAEFGDQVIEMRLGPRPGEMSQRSWQVGDMSAA